MKLSTNVSVLSALLFVGLGLGAVACSSADVDAEEKGTEAAAATAVLVAKTSSRPSPPVAVRFDRPFMFAIRDVPTGSILFLGRVTKPAP